MTTQTAITAATITDQQIRALYTEAQAASDLGQMSICLAALGRPEYRIMAILSDGQEAADEAHVGQAAGVPYEMRVEADTEAEQLDADRPDGHEHVRYEVRECRANREWARTECARVIADAQAQE